ncbi:XRE family transcriptional regulator [bacterium D16-50]|nr:XRE family transcriptional regulator [bacterium D16-50]
MFNKRLREMRMKRGYTQQKLADSVDIALRSYQCYETGTRTPCYDLLVRLADILDVSLDYLLGRDEFMKSHAISFDEYQ